jgi:hypothetical protein
MQSKENGMSSQVGLNLLLPSSGPQQPLELCNFSMSNHFLHDEERIEILVIQFLLR